MVYKNYWGDNAQDYTSELPPTPEDVRKMVESMKKAEADEKARAQAAIQKANEWGAGEDKKKADAEEARLQAIQDQRREWAEAELKATTRHSFALTMTDEEFEKAWPDMRLRLLADEATRQEAEAQQLQAKMYQSGW